MYLHKTTSTTANNTAPQASAPHAAEPPVRNATAAKSSAPQVPAPPRSASALIAAAGLPVDKLSASIVSFARFFSLPLRPELMAAIRRQTLAAPSAAAETQANAVKLTAAEIAAAKIAPARIADDSSAVAKNREALSLAAVVAESKGVELQAKGLEAFAEAIDPEWEKRQDSGGRKRRRNKGRQQEEENASSKTSPITAAALKAMALEAAEQKPLLAILNRLPAQNGRRWVALPFNFSEGGREFRVSLRILLEPNQSPSRANCMAAAKMAVDIAEIDETATGSPGTGQRWLFALEAAANGPANRLAVYLQPELPPKAHAPLERKLSALLAIPLERVSVKSWTETFPCEAGGADELLLCINEAV